MEISQTMLDHLARQAAASPRGRQHMLLHDSPAAPAQKLLNALMRHSYVQPHRHPSTTGVECLVALRGVFGFMIFDDHGVVRRTLRLGAGQEMLIVQIRPDDWHSLVAIEDGSILLEIKDGPHDPFTAKEMAAWAPAEGSEGAPAYLDRLHRLFLD